MHYHTPESFVFLNILFIRTTERRWTKECRDKQSKECRDKQTKEYRDKWKDEWTNEWINILKWVPNLKTVKIPTIPRLPQDYLKIDHHHCLLVLH